MAEKGGRKVPGSGHPEFAKGNPGGPGRPPGYRAKLTANFVKALFEDFDKYGASVIEAVRKDEPATYMRVLASMLPKEVTGENGEPIIANMTVTFVKPAG